MTAADASRANMVEQQIRTWDVLDDAVLDLYYELPRADFVPAEHRALAYADAPAPLPGGACMLEPKVEARLLQEAQPQPGETALHVGTGSGFFAALLAKLCARLVTVELDEALAQRAKELLERHGLRNATVATGDGLAGAIDGGPFDLIVLTGSVPAVPAAVLEQLTAEGRVLAPVGVAPVCQVQLLRPAGGQWTATSLFDTWIPPLRNAPAAGGFDF